MHTCDVIQQNESEVSKFDFHFCSQLYTSFAILAKLQTPTELVSWFQCIDSWRVAKTIQTRIICFAWLYLKISICKFPTHFVNHDVWHENNRVIENEIYNEPWKLPLLQYKCYTNIMIKSWISWHLLKLCKFEKHIIWMFGYELFFYFLMKGDRHMYLISCTAEFPLRTWIMYYSSTEKNMFTFIH